MERFDAWRVRQVRFVHVVTVHNLGDLASETNFIRL